MKIYRLNKPPWLAGRRGSSRGRRGWGFRRGRRMSLREVGLADEPDRTVRVSARHPVRGTLGEAWCNTKNLHNETLYLRTSSHTSIIELPYYRLINLNIHSRTFYITVRRFFGTLRRLHARGWAGSRSRPTRSARASTREFMLAWFYNLGATSNPPNGTWFQPSPARYSRITSSFEHIEIFGGFLMTFRRLFVLKLFFRSFRLGRGGKTGAHRGC